MKTLYFDCFSGISGDMVIGALIDAGADPAVLEDELKKLGLDEEYELKWYKVVKNGISSTKFDVVLTNEGGRKNVRGHDGREHDHGHVSGQPHSHEHDHHHEHGHHHDHHHDHQHEHGHHHEHKHHHEHMHHSDHKHELEHAHEHHHGHHPMHHHAHNHRAYRDIVTLIQSSALADEVKQTALKIFQRIGEAEGHIHGIPLEDVHFHEVGAVDSIVDIVGTAILIHQLGIEAVKSSPIAVGSGRIRIAHGIYPVPAPATLEILKGVPVEQTAVKGELATPTGAAIAAVLAEEFGTIPSMKVLSIGYGAGHKNFDSHPNVLRVIIGES